MNPTSNNYGARQKRMAVRFGDVVVSHRANKVRVTCEFEMEVGTSRYVLVRRALQRTAAEIHLLLKDTKAEPARNRT